MYMYEEHSTLIVVLVNELDIQGTSQPFCVCVSTLHA